MSIMSKKHIQVPNNMEGLNNIDLIVYAAIKSFKIKDNPCFPSQETIASKLNLTRPTIKKAIDRLVKEGYLFITKKGKLTYYEFSKYKKFEPFSDEFLENHDLDAKVKGYLIGSQQIMFKDIEGLGKTTMSPKDIAKRINVTEKTLKKYDKELEDKGYLTMVKTDSKDPLTGLFKHERIYNLEKLGQAIIWKLKEHDDRITDNEKSIKQLQEDNEFLKKQISILLNHINSENKEEEVKITI